MPGTIPYISRIGRWTVKGAGNGILSYSGEFPEPPAEDGKSCNGQQCEIDNPNLGGGHGRRISDPRRGSLDGDRSLHPGLDVAGDPAIKGVGAGCGGDRDPAMAAYR